jgi:hypothetical protein
MGCYLGVAEASMEPPAFIHLTYKPKGEVKKKVREQPADMPHWLPAVALTSFSVIVSVFKKCH